MTDRLAPAQDFYAVLGVDSDASAEEVRTAYRALAQRFHPDHNPNNMAAAQRMREINDAFVVLNSPAQRYEYDRRRAATPRPASGSIDPRGAGRGPRPYYRGKNWGLHTGAETPPQHIVRVAPTGFNMVVTVADECPSREVTIYNDAPFVVYMRVICSPWLAASAPELTVAAGSCTWLTIAITTEASHELRGWRDGGVSLVTDDPRVFCPDVRITAIFLPRAGAGSKGSKPHGAAEGAPLGAPNEAAPPAPEPDLRAVDMQTGRRRGWFQRRFGG